MFDMNQTARAMIDEALPDIIEGLLSRAKAGDIEAIKLVLQKGLGNSKPTAPMIPSNRLMEGSNLTYAEHVRHIIGDIFSGSLSLETGEAMLNQLKPLLAAEEFKVAEDLLEQMRGLQQ